MKLFAMPYDLDAKGFYFSDFEEYTFWAKREKNAHGQPVEEYEIQFIDGDDFEAALAQASEPTQGNLSEWIEFAESVTDDHHQAAILYCLTHRGDSFDDVKDMRHEDAMDFVVHVSDERCEDRAITDYAEHIADETGMLDGVPDNVKRYFDYEAFGRDMRLNGEIVVFDHGGKSYIMNALA